MLATHEDVSGRSNYHTMVGRFLMQHRNDLGLGSPEAPQGDRGSRWTKIGAADPHAGQEPRHIAAQRPTPAWPPQGQAQPPVQAPRHVVPQQYQPDTQSYPSVVRQRQPVMGVVLIALSIISVGLLSCVSPLWAASQVKHDPVRRRKLYVIAGVLACCLVLAFVVDSAIGAFLFLGNWVAGIVVAVMYRNPARI